MKTVSIVLCAGKGSRLKSSKSKILHEVCGRPLGYWSIKNALEATTMAPIVVLSHQAEQIEDELKKHFKESIRFAYQKTPDGTADAVKCALDQVDKDCKSILVVCGDTPLLRKESLAKLVTIQRKSHVPIALLSATAHDPQGYGRIVRDKSQQISAIVEDNDASPLEKEITEINPGVYVFDAKFLKENISAIKNNNAKGEYYLTDLVASYIKNGPKHGPVENVEIPYEEMHGINDRRQLAYAQKILNDRLLEKWMLDGVTIIDPSSTYIEESVRLSRDVVIYPGVHLRGETHVGEGAVIENGCVIKDTIIEANAHLLPYSCTDSAFVGESSELGPFARLRPNARLEKDVRVGNFVEIKNSRLKKGAKAGHLAYIGDAEVGERVNIGAGSITCNYDGKNKHKTVIGDDAFIGSNTTLIAPVTIGKQAYVGGGSSVNKEVPDGALAIGRAHQVNKDRKSADKKASSKSSELRPG